MKHYLTCLFVFLLSFLQVHGQEESDILINENYNGLSFIEFSRVVAEKYEVQIYSFTGWMNNLSIKQSSSPSFLGDILNNTFSGTELSFYINQQRQVVVSYGTKIRSEFNMVDSSEFAIEEQELVEYFSGGVHTSTTSDEFDSNWTIIGDPNSPEQKPEVKLSGYVRNLETGESLNGVLVYVEELKSGTATDSSGYYELNMRQGRYQLTFQGIGFKDTKIKLQLYASGELEINLGALVLNIEEVVVRADRKDNVESVQIGVEALKISTIKELPALFGEVDIVRSALMLPGVQSVGEFSSGINVRGGGADQNLILINGAPVYNASHLFGFSSSFSPDVVEGFELYKSSIPVKYGGRISSVLAIDMKEGNKDRWQLKGGISPVTSRISAEGPIGEKTTFIASTRATYSDWILKRLENAEFRNSSANYQDFTARIKTKFEKNNHLDISTYVSNDAFTLNGTTTFGYQNFNTTVKYQHSFNDRLFGTISGVYSQYNYDISDEENPVKGYNLDYKIRHTEAKAHFSYAAHEKHQINFGINAIHYNLSPGGITPTNPASIIENKELDPEKAIEGSIYLSDQWSILENLSLYAGLRYTFYGFLGPKTVNNYRANAARVEQNITGVTQYNSGDLVQSYSAPEFRVSMRYGLDDNTSIKAAANRNRQYLSMLFNSASISPAATWKLSDSHILPQTGDQVSLGIFRNLLDDKLELSVEGYMKRISNMIDYKAGAQLILNENLETDVVNGQGKASGIEVMLKKNGRKLNGWLSYTYSRTKFRADSPYFDDRINQGEWFPSNFDKPHDFSFVGFYRISRRFGISSNLIYSTGRPITIPVAKYQFSGGTRLQYSNRNEYRVPDQFRWDLSINLEGNHKKQKLAHSSWSLSVYNVLGRKNVYSIYFVSDGENAEGYKLSIFGKPIFTLTYNFTI
ncbi:MAG: hypothetical protein ACJA01_001017 [Saprospiraceae bacterium]|jgi:hypothetical protein